MEPRRGVDGEIAGWVRIGLGVVLAIPQLAIGFWAVIAPHDFYTSFPGFDPRLVAAEPPFNEHLTTDTGAGFLATGVALVVAALLAQRSGALVALAGYFAFAIPHAVYHSTHPAPGLNGSEDVFNTALLWVNVALALLFLWGAWPRTRPAARSA
jgi:hypothetical protein